MEFSEVPEVFLARILDGVPQPVWVIDEGGFIFFANPAAVAVLGYDELGDLRGKQSHETVHYKRPDGSPYPASECPMLRSRASGKKMHSEDEWFVRRDGSMFPIAWWSAPVELTTGHGAVLAFTDITEQRAAQEAIRERDAAEIRAAESRAAQRRIVEDAITTRRRMARDLHDGAQQCLVSLLIELRQARTALAAGQNIDKLLDGAIRDAQAAIDEVRELSMGIHPAVLSMSGLMPAIKALAGRVTLPVTITGALEARLPEAIEVSAYFIVAEALTNAIKHARASRVTVAVGIADSRLRVEICDDGVGGATLGGDGGGLAGLMDRVRALDGRLIMKSPSGAGTTLRAEIPLSDL